MTSLERELLWEPCGDPGLEHLRVTFAADGFFADGIIIRQTAGAPPFRLWYQIQCDDKARLRAARVRIECPEERHVDLRADGLGNWTGTAGSAMPELAGCIDIDIAATPFTNTLPIRRLGLKQGESAEIDLVYITVPILDVERARQRYTFLRIEGGNAVYLYENCGSDFRAELPVDQDGLVIDYQGQWRRIAGGGKR